MLTRGVQRGVAAPAAFAAFAEFAEFAEFDSEIWL